MGQVLVGPAFFHTWQVRMDYAYCTFTYTTD
jgi:hypothetical protein